jgi:hypothetical protein
MAKLINKVYLPIQKGFDDGTLQLLSFWTSSTIQYSEQNTTFPKLNASIFRWKGGKYLPQLCPLETAARFSNLD